MVDGERVRGPKDARGVMAERLLTTARETFAAVGFDRTTLRGVARDSGVDPALVRYYYGTKEELFRAALGDAPPDYVGRVGEVEASPRAERGWTIAHVTLAAWEDPETALLWRSLFLSAMTEPTALTRLESYFAGMFAATLGHDLDPAEHRLREALATADIVGVVTGRYLWRMDGLATEPLEVLEASLGAQLQHHLLGDLEAQGDQPRPDVG